MRRTTSWVLLLVVALVLSGCAGLPDSSEVRQRQPIGSASPVKKVDVRAAPPTAGASPQAIAEGFLNAHRSRPDNFGVARDYLTQSANTSWQPDEHGIVVLRNVNYVVSTRNGASQMTLSSTAQARTDKDGHLTQLAAPQTVSIPFKMVKQDGQWRISELPADLGLWLFVREFEDRYEPRAIYYAAAGSAPVLVPDWRWFPEGAGPTVMANAALKAAPSWLRPAVRQDLSQVLTDAVAVSRDNVATVQLGPEALAITPENRRALWARMLRTLLDPGRASTGAQRVQLKVGDSQLVPPGNNTNPETEADLDYSVVAMSPTDVIVRTADQLRWSSGAGSSDRPRPKEPAPTDRSEAPLPTLGTNWYMLAANGGGAEIAAISGDRTTLARWREQKLWHQPPSFGRQLTRPSYDQFDGLWVAGQARVGTDQPGSAAPKVAGPATVWVLDTQTSRETVQAQAVTAPWLTGQDVISLAVAPEGKRLALVLRDRKTSKTRLVLSGVVRQNRQVVSLTPGIDLNPTVDGLLDVTWTDDGNVAALGTLRGSATVQPLKIPVNGGPAEPMGRAPGAVSIAAEDDSREGLYIVTDRNSILARQGQTWQSIEVGQDIAVPVSSAGVDIPGQAS